MAFDSFGLKSIVVGAALVLLAACETAPEKEAESSGGGTTSSTTPSQPSSPGIVAGTQEDLVANVGDRVFFNYDSSELRAEGRAQVEKWAAWLKQHPNVSVTITGHCDERGTREYNLGLGERRAEAARRYLVALGVSRTRVGTISFGKERPVCGSSTESCYAQNRRGVMSVN